MLLETKALSVGIIDNLSASFKEGLNFVLGQNASGKTTLLKTLCGIAKPNAGFVLVGGRHLKRPEPKLIAYMPQELPSSRLKSYELVLLGRKPYYRFTESRRDLRIALKWMKLLKIGKLAKKPFDSLSGGQKSLVFLARALAQETPVLILDEPDSYLDTARKLFVFRLLSKLKKTVIVASHDVNLAVSFADNILILKDGRKIFEGKASELSIESISRAYETNFIEGWVGGKRFFLAKL